MNSQTTELLPCPFCGGEAYVSPRTCNRDTPYNPADRAFPVVRCRACFAEAVGENWGEPATAVTAWNRRAALEHAQRVAPRMLSWKEIEAVAETEEITGDGICVFGEELLRKFCEVNGITSDAATPSAGEARDAARDVIAERQQQISREGYMPAHDDEHSDGSIALAAAAYAIAGTDTEPRTERDMPPSVWPWDDQAWKPKDARRNLVRAGALILAEIERLDRAILASGSAG